MNPSELASIGSSRTPSRASRGGRRRQSQTAPVAVAALGALLIAPAAAAQTFIGLGFPVGGYQVVPAALSADGAVVVGIAYGRRAGDVSAFLWTRDALFRDLGKLPGDDFAEARGVSADGSVVVGRSMRVGVSPEQAFRWTAASGMQALGVLPGDVQSLGRAVSADGSVVVGWSSTEAGIHAFRWTALGGLTALLAGSAHGVNRDGSVIVGGYSTTAGDRAFRWTSAGGVESLGTLPGESWSYASAVSADGLVVGGSGSSYRPFRWTATGGMQALAMPPGSTFAYVNGVSGDGSVIVGEGWPSTGRPPPKAVMWSAETGVVDLNVYLAARGMELNAWFLKSAFAVSVNGRAICGIGLHNGETEGWLAILPDPPCQANCNADRDPMTGTHRLDIGDFVCFQNAFALGDYKADVGGGPPEPGQVCNSDGYFTIEDFVCFQNLFALGCK